ncbi:hypothetical protein DJ93_2089 [Bacillus clarus]|uniref:Uncharacterized protein n=2 Tax=Bacillus clarus TaxID=2338372 RepID=A0A090YLZ9_9BACI|nr:hypothetical protein DJ93_2089 [Bacillus clarus]
MKLPIRGEVQMRKKKEPIKVIYKYSLFQYLVKNDCQFLYSTRNRSKSEWQCHMFLHDERLDQALDKYPNERYVNGEKYSRF